MYNSENPSTVRFQWSVPIGLVTILLITVGTIRHLVLRPVYSKLVVRFEPDTTGEIASGFSAWGASMAWVVMLVLAVLVWCIWTSLQAAKLAYGQHVWLRRGGVITGVAVALCGGMYLVIESITGASFSLDMQMPVSGESAAGLALYRIDIITDITNASAFACIVAGTITTAWLLVSVESCKDPALLYERVRWASRSLNVLLVLTAAALVTAVAEIELLFRARARAADEPSAALLERYGHDEAAFWGAVFTLAITVIYLPATLFFKRCLTDFGNEFPTEQQSRVETLRPLPEWIGKVVAVLAPLLVGIFGDSVLQHI